MEVFVTTDVCASDVAVDVAVLPTEQLEAETCTLAAQLAAATCRFVVLIGELERRGAWRSWGCRSLAHWLSWQCGLGPNAAREHVRVGRALTGLPQTTAAFAAGALSYSKVRALTRITDLDERQESALLEFAKVATASQLERTVGAYRQVVRNVDPDRARAQQSQVRCRVWHHDDGTVTIATRLAPDAAVIVLDALEQARKDIPRTEDVSAETSRAQAFEQVFRRYTQPDPHAAPRTELVIHADEQGNGCDSRHGIMLSVEAVRRLTCDAAVRRIVHGDTHDDVGRKQHKVPRKLRRKVVQRDGDRCRFAGCSARHYLHVHHIVHWDDGGPTDLDNLVLLCSYHHTLVHEGGWRVVGNPNQPLTFVSPEGRVLDEQPRALLLADWRFVPHTHHTVNGTAIRTAHGERLDLDWTISALCCLVPPDRN
jgi:uncharacterized protein DUF222/HNH endonuclease